MINGLFSSSLITALAIICIATTFVVVVPWFVVIHRRALRSIGFLVTSISLACLKLMVLVPILMLWAIGTFHSSFALWAVTVPFFADFLLTCRAARFFRVEPRSPPVNQTR